MKSRYSTRDYFIECETPVGGKTIGIVAERYPLTRSYRVGQVYMEGDIITLYYRGNSYKTSEDAHIALHVLLHKHGGTCSSGDSCPYLESNE